MAGFVQLPSAREYAGHDEYDDVDKELNDFALPSAPVTSMGDLPSEQ